MALTRYGQTADTGTCRLRVGDWRVRFQEKKGEVIYVLAVGHRSEACGVRADQYDRA